MTEGEVCDLAQRLVDALQHLLQQQQQDSSTATTAVETLVDDSLAAVGPLLPVQDLGIPSEVPTAADISDVLSLSDTEEYQVHYNMTAAQLKTRLVIFCCCNTSCQVIAWHYMMLY